MIRIFFLALLITAHAFCIDYEELIDPNIYKNQYGIYFVPLNHNRPAVNTIRNGGVYELATLEAIKKIYKEGTSIIHTGTYFGDMLPFFSKLVGSQEVWAFEPVRLNYACAVKNIQINQLRNVNLFNLALSDRSQQVVMRTANKEEGFLGGGSQIVPFRVNNESADFFELVETTTIDEILSDHPNEIGIIHLDVEGHELHALIGAKKTIEAFHPIVIVEGWPQKIEELDRYMTKNGYKKFLKEDENDFYNYCY